VLLERGRVNLVVKDGIWRSEHSVVNQYAQSAPIAAGGKQIAKKMEQRASETQILALAHLWTGSDV
jgi:hypothetical protein